MAPQSPKGSHSPKESQSSEPSQTPEKPTSPSLDKPRLTEKEKKSNHIRSEQKRREAIRDGFDRLAVMVGMEGQGRSEALVLQQTVKAIHEEVLKRETLIAEAQRRGIDTIGWQLPAEIVEAVKAQIARVEADEKETARQQAREKVQTKQPSSE